VTLPAVFNGELTDEFRRAFALLSFASECLAEDSGKGGEKGGVKGECDPFSADCYCDPAYEDCSGKAKGGEKGGVMGGKEKGSVKGDKGAGEIGGVKGDCDPSTEDCYCDPDYEDCSGKAKGGVKGVKKTKEGKGAGKEKLEKDYE
jgi:hypothetical protein